MEADATGGTARSELVRLLEESRQHVRASYIAACLVHPELAVPAGKLLTDLEAALEREQAVKAQSVLWLEVVTGLFQYGRLGQWDLEVMHRLDNRWAWALYRKGEADTEAGAKAAATAAVGAPA